MSSWIKIPLFFCLCTIQSCAQSGYTYRQGDPNGIGKWFMGREIALVMSHEGMDWLERTEREEEENTVQLIRNLRLKSGEKVADIGAGTGYHVERMAPLVGPAGSVAAVDIQPEMLSFLQQKMKDKGITNVLPVLGTEQRCGLPPGSIDKALLVDVYHEFAFPREMMRSIFESLRPGGLVYLVEFRAEDPAVPIKEIHKMSQKQAVKEWEAAGFVFQENIANLPWQHCLVFRR